MNKDELKENVQNIRSEYILLQEQLEWSGFDDSTGQVLEDLFVRLFNLNADQLDCTPLKTQQY